MFKIQVSMVMILSVKYYMHFYTDNHFLYTLNIFKDTVQENASD